MGGKEKRQMEEAQGDGVVQLWIAPPGRWWRTDKTHSEARLLHYEGKQSELAVCATSSRN